MRIDTPVHSKIITKMIDRVLAYYVRAGRHAMAWRIDTSAYSIFLSEVMLQQTQVARVTVKYAQFRERFPTFDDLAHASITDVLVEWQGLGYNRRGKYLHEAARIVVSQYAGQLPREPDVLRQLPGIGVATAASIATFAYDVPTVFIETNVRTVILHECFPHEQDVTDDRVRVVAERALQRILRSKRATPRVWYWALMDYGSHLKSTEGNVNVRSAHYKRQKPFQGSDRQIRGQLLRDFVRTRQIPLLSNARAHALWKKLIAEGLVQT